MRHQPAGRDKKNIGLPRPAVETTADFPCPGPRFRGLPQLADPYYLWWPLHGEALSDLFLFLPLFDGIGHLSVSEILFSLHRLSLSEV